MFSQKNSVGYENKENYELRVHTGKSWKWKQNKSNQNFALQNIAISMLICLYEKGKLRGPSNNKWQFLELFWPPIQGFVEQRN